MQSGVGRGQSVSEGVSVVVGGCMCWCVGAGNDSVDLEM